METLHSRLDGIFLSHPFYTSYKGWKLCKNSITSFATHAFYTSYKGWKLNKRI